MMNYRPAVDVGVVDAHRRVQQADDVVDDGGHRLAASLGIAMGDLHGDLFVVTEQHRRLVLAIIDQRVVEPAKARAGIERDIGKFVLLDQIDDDVGLPTLGGFLDFGFAHADLLPRANIKSGNAAQPFLMSEIPPRVTIGGHSFVIWEIVRSSRGFIALWLDCAASAPACPIQFDHQANDEASASN